MLTAPSRKQVFFPLVVTSDGPDWVVAIPRSSYLARAALLVLVVPPLFAMLAGLFWLLLEEPTEVARLFLVRGAAALSIVSVAGGFVLAALSGPLSRRSSVRLDRRRRVVVRARDGLTIPFHAIAAVRARRGGIGLGGVPATHGIFTAIELVDGGGRALLALHERLSHTHAADIEALVAFVGATLRDGDYRAGHAVDERVDLGARVDPFGFGEREAATLCYVPFGGIGLFASIYYLALGDERPFVRFAARQSLVVIASSIFVLLAIGAFGVAPVVAFDVRALPVLVALGLALVVTIAGHLVALILAMAAARRGEILVVPWLRFLVRRWLPR